MSPLQRQRSRAAPRRINRRVAHDSRRPHVLASALPGIIELWNAQCAEVIAGVLTLLVIGALLEFFNSDLFYVYGLRVHGRAVS